MFRRLGLLVVHRRRLVLALTALFVALAAVAGSGVFDALKGGGFEDPRAESTRARQLLEDRFHQGDPNVVLLFTPAGGSVDSAAASAAGAALTERLAAEPGVATAASYWSLGKVAPLRSASGDKALVLGFVEGDVDRVKEVARRVVEELEGATADGTVEVGGMGAVFDEMSHRIESDLAKAEAIAIPITLVLLVLIFGGLVAASLPLLVGVVAIFGGFLSLFVIAQLTDVSIFSINLTTAMGLGLAIDYSLFILSRFREELRAGETVDNAVLRTVETAGRTVAFSGLTVAVSLSALLVFPLYFLRSFAYAGVATVLVAGVASVVSLPALLAVLGPRVDRLQLVHRPAPEAGTGFWHRVATFVMRRPVGIAAVVVVFLLLLGAPFLGVRFGTPDDRAMPASAASRQVSEQIRNEFGSNESHAFGVLLDGDSGVSYYAVAVSRLDNVARVDAATGSYVDGTQVAGPGPATARFTGGSGAWISVVPAVEPVSTVGERLVKEIRGVPTTFEVSVGGQAAQLVDSKQAILDRLPLAGAIIAVATFILLFLSFGSVVVPLKAILLNLLSLTATFGATVFIFQQGHGAGLLDFTPTGTLDTTTPILMFCVAFGLSMDYEVFLLSRIKEEHDRTGDNAASVAMGLERTGRIVTAAAALLAVTFLAMVSSGVTFIKLFGLGLAIAVVMDATVIRATLVPAFMRLAGEANWWAPKPLRWVYARVGLHEGASE
jgi:RND superfamily putative drug exporter